MSTRKLKGKDLRKINYRDNEDISLAIEISSKHYKHLSKVERLNILQDVFENPSKFKAHEFLDKLALRFLDKIEKRDFKSFELNDEPKHYKIYGKKFITQNAIQQMDTAMRLPIAEAGALMPDCHVGYGLPIGGVLATKNEVIPYGVGMDIGCRMALSIFDYPADSIKRNRFPMKQALLENTFFGTGKGTDSVTEHAIFERAEFKELDLLKQLHGKAIHQIGTSGSGNHFVEFGEVELEAENSLNMPAGNYLGLLSHSGSRGLGATVANFYTRIAMDKCRLPKMAQHLAWLDLNSTEGQEYWLAMNLAGDYAKACHDVIHSRLAKSLGLNTITKVENHHNFAWKETLNSEEYIVHRKGATPAKEGELGIIPGSMTAPGFIVSGKGQNNALNSASHGAGRNMSRKAAKESYTMSALKKHTKEHGIELIGAGIDEAPIAYKDINQVMASQTDLVNIEGKFIPKVVRMNRD